MNSNLSFSRLEAFAAAFEAALPKLRKRHETGHNWDGSVPCPDGSEHCWCGASKHNAELARLASMIGAEVPR